MPWCPAGHGCVGTASHGPLGAQVRTHVDRGPGRKPAAVLGRRDTPGGRRRTSEVESRGVTRCDSAMSEQRSWGIRWPAASSRSAMRSRPMMSGVQPRPACAGEGHAERTIPVPWRRSVRRCSRPCPARRRWSRGCWTHEPASWPAHSFTVPGGASPDSISGVRVGKRVSWGVTSGDASSASFGIPSG
jgi:hypothetical protein